MDQWKRVFRVISDQKAHFFAHSEIRKSKSSTKAPLVQVRACILWCISRINCDTRINNGTFGVHWKQWSSERLFLIWSCRTLRWSIANHVSCIRRASMGEILPLGAWLIPTCECSEMLVTSQLGAWAFCTVSKCNSERSKCLKTKTAPWESRLKYPQIFQLCVLAVFKDRCLKIFFFKRQTMLHIMH